MDTIDSVKEFAWKAHGDQRRKFKDEAYIEHPIRVMETCRLYSDKPSVLSAALLHDVLEDTNVSSEELYEFLLTVMDQPTAESTLQLVEELTDVYTHEAFPKLNRRARKEKEKERLALTSVDAQTIKYADIIDNAEDIVGSGDDFSFKFLYECRALLQRISKGNAELYLEAVKKVNEELGALTK